MRNASYAFLYESLLVCGDDSSSLKTLSLALQFLFVGGFSLSGGRFLLNLSLSGRRFFLNLSLSGGR
ncbi:hypothetical protein ACFLW2_00745, partial [Chloroflexota bacterium]